MRVVIAEDQALLRDLSRPVLEFRVTPELAEESDFMGRFRRAADSIREARTIAPLPQIAPLTIEVAEEMARRRAFIREPWRPFLSDDEPRRAVSFGPQHGAPVYD